MARASNGLAVPLETPRRSARNIKKEASGDDLAVKHEEDVATKTPKTGKRGHAPATPARRSKRAKTEDVEGSNSPAGKSVVKPSASPTLVKPEASPSSKSKSKEDKAAGLQAKKLKSYAQFANASPFPDFPHPTPAECKLAHRILASLHGERKRPAKVTAPTRAAGCGNSSSVLDALVRTILSQNTSDKNSTRAKLSMDAVYGGSDRWEAIVAGGQAKLQKAIETGGLAATKSRVIISVLQQARERYGAYSLDHLFEASNDDAMREMLGFQGVGPKTASCVLLFCLQRESFAVDTHVHRITGLLGWRPKDCSRDETHAHLDARIPDEDKYGLHILIITHGRQCEECKAGGKNLGKCELRNAFRHGKVEGLAGEEIKHEEIEHVKKEELDVETTNDAIAHAVE
ncbi:base excision DNA repair protein [Xylariaceae sp. FL0662B]|nr:base excision DNA repair protein [Xylariaceae sp. FL0662B]